MLRLESYITKSTKIPKSVRAKGIPKDEPESTDAKVRRVKKDPEQNVQLEIKQRPHLTINANSNNHQNFTYNSNSVC